MKKNITIAVIVILALALGYYLFKISPQTQTPPGNLEEEFNLSGVTDLAEPRILDARDYVLGNASAKNIMIIYEDFECPACASYAPIAKQFPQALPDTKLVFRHYPLSQHKNAVAASYAAEAAGLQGKFWEIYDRLYQRQDDWAGLGDPFEVFAQIAQEAGIPDIEQFRADIGSKKGREKIQDDLVEALSLKVGGTPTLYFNGKLLQLGNVDQVKTQAEKLYR